MDLDQVTNRVIGREKAENCNLMEERKVLNSSMTSVLCRDNLR